MPKRKCKSEIPFARGFKAPSLSDQKSAIGEDFPKDFEFESDGSFQSIPNPTSIDDWLAQYNEEGQSFNEFLDQTPWLSERKIQRYTKKFLSKGSTIQKKYPDGKIYLVQLGDFDANLAPRFQDLAHFASLYYDLPVGILTEIPLLQVDKNYHLNLDGILHESDESTRRRSERQRCPKIDHRKHGNKIQLACVDILNTLKSIIPGNALCLIGLTMSDLFEANPDLFVAGLASGYRRVAVFSFARYDPTLTFSTEFWFEMKRSRTDMSHGERTSLIMQRSCKLLVHEIGHLLGLDHCIFFSCCMNGSGHLSEDYAQPIFLCPVCLRKIHALCGINVVKRYREMRDFFQNHDMVEEVQWIDARINFLSCKSD